MTVNWCMTCCTRHSIEQPCPGELAATGPERYGWRVNVETPRGIEAFGVLVAPSGDLWRARVLTYPNILWLVPGGRGTLKFVGATAEDAEGKAREYVREHCRAREYTPRNELMPLEDSIVGGASGRSPGEPAPRKIRFIPVSFGVAAPTETAGTGNLSETGMFIITDESPASGTRLTLRVDIDQATVELIGSVVWMRTEPHVGRSPGMGIRLDSPPEPYLDYVRALR
jgi:hypothetical protein